MSLLNENFKIIFLELNREGGFCLHHCIVANAFGGCHTACTQALINDQQLADHSFLDFLNSHDTLLVHTVSQEPPQENVWYTKMRYLLFRQICLASSITRRECTRIFLWGLLKDRVFQRCIMKNQNSSRPLLTKFQLSMWAYGDACLTVSRSVCKNALM